MSTFKITNMLTAEIYDHAVKNIELIETHISWVILTGNYAYKIKKPVNFGFLDFSTLEKRQACCISEVLLNRRLAPELYLEVVSIAYTGGKPVINGKSIPVEYAVKMLQFPQSAQLDNMLAAGKLKTRHMDAIAHMVANFHQSVAVADNALAYGNSKAVFQPVEENFIQIREHLDTAPFDDTLDKLHSWSRAVFDKLEAVFTRRKQQGFIRECHGDMHLRNMLWLKSAVKEGPVAFDCIEFNSQLRWIDVISEAAFLVMDLQDRQQPQLANRFLNTYLETTGDYPGLAVLRFYLCYRALVRAKVSALRLEQANIRAEETAETVKAFRSYLELATSYTQPTSAKLIIMRGLSASGKSTLSQQLVDMLGAIRIRSDVERKRLFAITADDSRPGQIDSGIYSSAASQQTYKKLQALAVQVINAGYNAIIDAAFLKHAQRQAFQQLANDLDVPYIIIEVTAPAEILRQRIIERTNDVSDADLSVLEHQLENWQALQADETNNALSVDTSATIEIEALINRIKNA